MKFTLLIASLFALLLPLLALADIETVSYDQTYDNPSGSLSSVACSDGEYGLESIGYTTFSSLPDFPYIGGAAAVAGWDSPNCGTCWQLSWTGAAGTNTINVLAVDYAAEGFNIALEAMNTLTGGLAQELGRVNASVTQVDPSVCGL